MLTFSRSAWAAYRCAGPRATIPQGTRGARITVSTVAAPAFEMLDRVLLAHGHDADPATTGAYVCRNVAGTNTPSPHAYAAATDRNWTRNPARARGSVPSNRHDPRFTEYGPAAIRDVLAIRTRSGRQVFGWGGGWRTFYDPMHFEVVTTPAHLATGVVGAMSTWEQIKGYLAALFGWLDAQHSTNGPEVLDMILAKRIGGPDYWWLSAGPDGMTRVRVPDGDPADYRPLARKAHEDAGGKVIDIESGLLGQYRDVTAEHRERLAESKRPA